MRKGLKTTLLELLDAAPRLQKRLASMSLSSGKPIFHIDMTDEAAVKNASEQALPSIFFIKNLLSSDTALLQRLKQAGQVIGFLKIEAPEFKLLKKRPWTELFETIDCCVVFSDIAPLTNRLILGCVSQALASFSMNTLPHNYLYWGSWHRRWTSKSEASFDKILSEITYHLHLSDRQAKSLTELTRLGGLNIFRRRGLLQPMELNCGCDGTLLVATVRYKIQNEKYLFKLQKQIITLEHDYLAIEMGELRQGYLTISKFIPVSAKDENCNQKLLILLNSDKVAADILAHEDKKAG